jgi:hypothetical protein
MLSPSQLDPRPQVRLRVRTAFYVLDRDVGASTWVYRLTYATGGGDYAHGHWFPEHVLLPDIVG